MRYLRFRTFEYYYPLSDVLIAPEYAPFRLTSIFITVRVGEFQNSIVDIKTGFQSNIEFS